MTEHEHEGGDFAAGERTAAHTAGDDAPGQFGGHAEHLRMGSFADTSCPGCVAIETGHAEHVRMGTFADTSCPKCQAMTAG